VTVTEIGDKESELFKKVVEIEDIGMFFSCSITLAAQP
jgi:hypothetical protein